MLVIDEELIKVGSYYIRQHEFVLDSETKNPQSALDRGEIALQLLTLELDFQFSKIGLVEQVMEAYEHTTDPLQQVRLCQQVTDLMAHRPRLNMDATYFGDSYRNETDLMKRKTSFYKELIQFQIQQEKEQNRSLRTFQELKFRKIQDHMHAWWTYQENALKEERIGSIEDDMEHNGVSQKLKEKLMQKGIMDKEKGKKMEAIAKRHLTEFAN
jgi:hypothetical protein